MPLRRVLQFRVSDPEIDVAIVVPILDVLQETPNHRRRNHVGHPLRDVAAVALESHAHHLARLEHRAAAVPGIDLRADLDREVRVGRGVGVKIEIDPRHDAGGDRHPLAADRITVGRDRRFERGNPAELQRLHPFPEGRVRHLDEREIAIVRHEKHRRRILIRVPLALHREIARVADHVRVGQNALPVDHKPGADPAPDRPGIPRGPIIRFHLRGSDPDETALDLTVRLRLRLRDEEERERAQEKMKSVHQEKSGKVNRKRAGVKRQSEG